MAKDVPAWLDACLKSPEDAVAPELIQTHISWVLLTGDLAYKIKKPVDFGFVNFLSKSDRRHFCFEELRLNRRLAPQLYLQVCGVYVQEDSGVPKFIKISEKSADPILPDFDCVDYAVCMRRFADADLLPHALRDGRIDQRHMIALADQVAGFHQSIAIADAASSFGEPRRLVEPAKANFTFLNELGEIESYRASIAALRQWSASESDRLLSVMSQRREMGMVRECHGDMHLGNMTLTEDGQVQIFDGIEFNDRFRWIDVASEIAFLIMDLMDRGRSTLANTFLNRYLEQTGDYQLLTVLPFYMVYRALVRAKVTYLRLIQSAGIDASLDAKRDKNAIQKALSLNPDRRTLTKYIDLACWIIESRKRMVLINHGVSGSGKSYWTQRLIETQAISSDMPWLIRLRSDVERKRLAGSARDADLYAKHMTEKTYGHLAVLSHLALNAGFSPIIDATFIERSRREIFQLLAEEQAVSYGILSFDAPDELLHERLQERQALGQDPSDADGQIMMKQRQAAEPFKGSEKAYVLLLQQNASDDNQILHAIHEFIRLKSR